MRPEFNENGMLIDNIIKNRRESLEYVKSMITTSKFDIYSREQLLKIQKTLENTIDFYVGLIK